MPIYEYACEACGHQFEKLVRIGADAPPCPECEAGEVRKLISASGFILKGSGWYKDHYGLKGSSSKGGSEGKKSTSGGSDSGGSGGSGGSSSGGDSAAA